MWKNFTRFGGSWECLARLTATIASPHSKSTYLCNKDIHEPRSKIQQDNPRFQLFQEHELDLELDPKEQRRVMH
jgi:hypothetical protein